MSIITTFPDIRGSVVYLFCYEIDHHTFAILSLFRFGDHVLFSLRSRRLEVVGARKNGARERDTRIFSRARSALYVAGTCFTSTFPQLRSPPPSCQPREKWCFSQKQREVIFDLPRQLPPKVREMTALSNSPPFGPKSWTCPCGCPRGSNKSYWTVHQWHFRKSEASFPV